MADPISTGLSFISGNKDRKQAQNAASTQAQSAQQGIDLTREQAEIGREDLQPFVQAGIPALQQLGEIGNYGLPAMEAQASMLGLGGPEAYQAQLDQVQNGPQFQAMYQQGEDAMLQNASATGGLRGGNIQGALAQYRPQMLDQLMQQRMQGLGGIAQNSQNSYNNLASLGQSSAAGQANQGMQSANNISNLLGQQGSAIAGGQLAPSGFQNAIGQIQNDRSMIKGMGAGMLSRGGF